MIWLARNALMLCRYNLIIGYKSPDCFFLVWIFIHYRLMLDYTNYEIQSARIIVLATKHLKGK